MSTNKIEQSSVSVRIRTTRGYVSDETFPPSTGTQALEAGLAEITRLMAINGNGQLAREIVEKMLAA